MLLHLLRGTTEHDRHMWRECVEDTHMYGFQGWSPLHGPNGHTGWLGGPRRPQGCVARHTTGLGHAWPMSGQVWMHKSLYMGLLWLGGEFYASAPHLPLLSKRDHLWRSHSEVLGFFTDAQGDTTIPYTYGALAMLVAFGSLFILLLKCQRWDIYLYDRLGLLKEDQGLLPLAYDLAHDLCTSHQGTRTGFNLK